MSDALGNMKERSRATWSKGDYSAVGVMFVPVSEQLCDAVEIRAGQTVLDVATGTGNTALAAARRFCDVTGVDFVPSWLERARERAAVERLPILFLEGDAEALPFPDNSFDVVLSTFGCMFAPNQEKTAAELLRVCRPGGKIGLANWTPEGYVGQILKTVMKYAAPPPPGFRSPVLWGTEARLQQLFADQVASMDCTRRVLHFRFLSLAHANDVNNKYTGPITSVYESLDDARKAEFSQEMESLMSKSNRSGDSSLLIPSDYLEAVMIKR